MSTTHTADSRDHARFVSRPVLALVTSIVLVTIAAGCGSEESTPALTIIDRSAAAEIVRRDVVASMDDPRRTLALMVPETVRAGSEVTDLSSIASAAAEAGSNDPAIEVESDSWLVYVDPSPWQRFAHPVKWAFVDASTGQVRLEDAWFWPTVEGKSYFSAPTEQEVRAHLVHPLAPTLGENESIIPPEVLSAAPDPADRPPPSLLVHEIDDVRCTPSDPPPTTYVLLVQAGSRSDMSDDVTSLATAWHQRVPASQVRHVRSGASSDVTKVLQEWAPRVRCCDRLFIYIVGHGPKPSQHVKNLAEVLVDEGWPGGPGTITQIEIANWTAAVDALHVEMYIDACYSGRFIPLLKTAMATRKRATEVSIMTSSSATDTSIQSPVGYLASLFGGGQGYSPMTRGFADAIIEGAGFWGATTRAIDESSFVTGWSKPKFDFFTTPGEPYCGIPDAGPGDDAAPDAEPSDSGEDSSAPDAGVDAPDDAGAGGSGGMDASVDAAADANDAGGAGGSGGMDASTDASADATDTGAGGYTVESCSELPGDFPYAHPWNPGPGETIAVVCVEPGGVCRVSNDTYEDQPLAPTQCSASAGHSALSLGIGSTAPFAQAGPGWRLLWTSYGEGTADRPRFNTAEAVIAERASDLARFRFEFRPLPTSYTVYSVTPHTGPLPAYGQSYDCAGMPLSFNDPYVDSPAQYFARICIHPSTKDCRVHGNIESTVETESCISGPYAMILGYTDVFPGPFAGGEWNVLSTTHGTIDNNYVANFPANTEIVVTMASPSLTTTYAVRFIWTGAGYDILQIERL